MKAEKLHLVYFSATGTTRKVMRQIAEGFGVHDIQEHAVLSGQSEVIHVASGEPVIFGVPVYAGRVPALAATAIQQFKGEGTPAVLVAVYGNREYDDALLELKDIVQANGFKAVAAGAFIAEHSIFPDVAKGRPDERDAQSARQFGADCQARLEQTDAIVSLPDISLKGNFPYRPAGNVPLKPKGNRQCNKCGACVKVCPTQAIPQNHPRMTYGTRCISCGHCIYICPQKARHYGGIIYKIARRKFVAAYAEPRKEAEVFFI